MSPNESIRRPSVPRPGFSALTVVPVDTVVEPVAFSTVRWDRADRAAADTMPASSGLAVVLSAQERAKGFYERCGYRTVPGERCLDVGIWHRRMSRVLVAPAAEGDPR